MSRPSLIHPSPKSIIYEDPWLYVCLARYPITKGHTIVVWKKRVFDLHDLSDSEYDYLMEIVDIIRDVLLKVYAVEKVYLIYMDEIQQVHWHLIPRYNEKGFNMLFHKPRQTKDFSRVRDLKKVFTQQLQSRKIRIPKRKLG